MAKPFFVGVGESHRTEQRVETTGRVVMCPNLRPVCNGGHWVCRTCGTVLFAGNPTYAKGKVSGWQFPSTPKRSSRRVSQTPPECSEGAET